jgi:hypothetical protein
MRRDEDVTRTADGERFDPKTGELFEPVKRGRRGRPKRSTEEDAEAKRVREARAELRRAEVAAMRAIDPACETENDPPVVWRAPVRMGGDPRGVIFTAERLSGRGLPGSQIVCALREYDGCGPNGGPPHVYLTTFTTFADSAGYRRRSMGSALRREEWRPYALSVLRLADEYDARDAEQT